MKKNILLFLTLWGFVLSQGQTVNHEEAIVIGKNFFTERYRMHHPDLSIQVQVRNVHEIFSGGKPVIYAVNLIPEGYVLVSASGFTFPVLSYNMTGKYTGENEPENYQAWIRYFGRQVEFADQSDNTAPEIVAARKKFTENNIDKLSPAENLVVEPLLNTTWDQGIYYNGMCPADPGGPGGHCWAGCVATAVGQLMFYHRWPNQGTGEYSYTHPVYGEQYANFGETTYNWNGMETSLNGPNDHLALLLNQLGISFDMDYGPNGSGMWNHSAANSMRNFFKYGPQTQYIFRDTTTMNWDSILTTNLDSRKPLYYAGWEGVGSQNGHAFVCDGYAPDNFYHFNWGWSSSYDGYFLLSALTPGGNNFNFAQEVIKDIYPDTLLYNYPEFCSGPDTLETIAGTFSDGSNMVDYQNNSDCFWLIRPDEPDFDSITSINLDFPLVNLSGNDRIRVYQGTDTTSVLIADISGTSSPATINIPTAAFLVRFTSDETGNAGGFLGSFRSVLPVYCYGTTTFTDSTGLFDDGSGIKKYNNSAVCKWKITPENQVPITLTFNSFETESGSDVLRIYDLGTQQLVATYSGDSIPDPLTIPSGKAYLVFMTNKQITAPGWTIRWAPAGTTGISEPADSRPVIYPNPVEDKLWIKQTNQPEKQLEISIYNTSGSLLKKEIIQTGHQSVINTGSLKAGIYFLTISGETGIHTFRFAKL
ncbi:MAG: C10 family peptidase [Bacteroidota bacterium]